jgi:hypothetical protein
METQTKEHRSNFSTCYQPTEVTLDSTDPTLFTHLIIIHLPAILPAAHIQPVATNVPYFKQPALGYAMAGH